MLGERSHGRRADAACPTGDQRDLTLGPLVVSRRLPCTGYYEQYAGYGFWAAIEKASGAFIGWFHFRPPPGRPDDVELGYRLRTAKWTERVMAPSYSMPIAHRISWPWIDTLR